MQYKEKHRDLQRRVQESSKIKEKYPDRIPVICEKAKGAAMPDIDKTKYLVPSDLSAYQFSYIIRKRMNLPKERSLWLFVNGKYALKGDTLMSEVYGTHKDPDGFLYICYSGENVYGN